MSRSSRASRHFLRLAQASGEQPPGAGDRGSTAGKGAGAGRVKLRRHHAGEWAGQHGTAERGGTQWRSIFGDPMHETRDGRGRARHTAGDIATVELGEA
jgi:hypothetical protein